MAHTFYILYDGSGKCFEVSSNRVLFLDCPGRVRSLLFVLIRCHIYIRDAQRRQGIKPVLHKVGLSGISKAQWLDVRYSKEMQHTWLTEDQ